jgi:hypothetical protein
MSHHEETERWIALFRHADRAVLREIEQNLIDKRVNWFKKNYDKLENLHGDMLEKAYQILLLKIGVDKSGAPVVEKTGRCIVFHSHNFCPSLQACAELGLDTRVICKAVFEKPADVLVKQLHPDLQFNRNYTCIRPYSPYCEEKIFWNLRT